MVLLNALHGTPFPHYALFNLDAVRLAALADRFSTTRASADAFVPGIPSEYPPLYPWLIGRAAALVDRPAWSLLGDAEIVVISGAVVAAFVLWKRLVGAPAALALAALAPVVFTDPHKSYEILTLAVFTPWVLATFTGRSRAEGGLHWLPAGVIGGLFVTTYTGYLLFGAIGVLAVIAVRLFRPDRRAYLLHLLGVLALTGMVGILWYRRREWWAQPLLLIVAGVYLYWLVFALRLVQSGHTGFLVKTPKMVTILLATAGVLTLIRAAAAVFRRLDLVPPRTVGVAALAVLLVWSRLTAWRAWTPGDPRGYKDVEPRVKAAEVVPNPAFRAHLEPLPDGTRSRFAPTNLYRRQIPADLIARLVEDRLGAGVRPMTLSADMRLFAYLPWYAYEQRGQYSANSLMRYTDRYDELLTLTEITDPARFAQASAHTRFGGIDVFVLRKRDGEWKFSPRIAFSPSVFRGRQFDVVENLPADLALAVRSR